MLPRSRQQIFSISQHEHLHSLSPTTGKSDIPQIKGKKIKNNITSIKKISVNSKFSRTKKNSDYDSIIHHEGVLSDRHHYQIKPNSIIEQTKRKRRKSALSFMEGNVTQKEKIREFDEKERQKEKAEGRGGNLRPTKTWTNPNKLKSKHFLSMHNQSVKSTPRTYLQSRIIKKVEKKGSGKLKECSLDDLRRMITKMIDVEIDKKLAKNTKQLSATKIIQKRKSKKQETIKKKSNDMLVLRIKELKTMTNSLIPNSDTVEDINYETERKQHPLRSLNLQTTQSLALLKNLVNITFEEELDDDEISGGSVQDIAASKIKRVWKKFRTEKIIQQYASLFQQIQNQNDNNNQNQNYSAGGKFFTEEQPFSINDSYLDEKNENQNPRFKFQNRLDIKPHIQRPNNIPSKRTQIKSLEDALIFIKEEIGVESPNTILHNLINGIQQQREYQEDRKGEQENKQKKGPSSIESDGKNKVSLNMFDEDLVESQSHNNDESFASNRWDFLSNIKDLQLISDSFQKRQRSLVNRREEQITILDRKLKQARITQKQHKEQLHKIQVWTKHQLSSLYRIKRSLQKGLSDAQSIINKNKQDVEFSDLQKNPGLRKCLSTQYIKRIKVSDIPSPSPIKQQSPKLKPSINTNTNNNRIIVNNNIDISNSAELKRLKKKLDSANNRQKSFPSDQEFFSEELKLDESKSEMEEEEVEEEYQDVSPTKSLIEDKLKNLDVDEKDDIFEFAFLDLCIEFCQEIYCDQDGMKIALEYISKSKKKGNKSKNRGIKTNINTVKEYLRQLKAYVNRTNKTVFSKIKQPLGPTAKQMLKYMHYSEDQFKEKQDYDISSTLVLTTSIFQTFQNNLLPGIQIQAYYSDEAKQKSRVKFLKDIIHIHNKAIFDCLNESLDMERPFGMWGAPFPWKTTSKFSPQLTGQDLEEKYIKAEEKVVQCCSYFCGLLVDKEDSLISPGSKISQEYLEQVKEDRLSRMLAADLLEGEERWLFYDDEETETLVEIAQIVYEILVREVVADVKTLTLPFEML